MLGKYSLSSRFGRDWLTARDDERLLLVRSAIVMGIDICVSLLASYLVYKTITTFLIFPVERGFYCRDIQDLSSPCNAYFGFRSRHPLMSSSQVPAKQLDQEWMRRMIIRQIEDFVDLSRPEKEFIKLWNLFVLDSNNRPFGWCHMYRTCRLFLEEHREELVAKDLRRAWVYHLAAFNEKDALDADETYDLTQRLNADYDPTSDKCHIVYRTRTCDEQPSTSTKRKTPAWQRAPIPGPKASILRSASVTSRLSSVGGPSSDSEEVLKKFPDDSSRDERRCSSCSTDDVTRHNSVRRHRESDLSKYLMTTLRVADRPSKWFSFDEDSAP
ncbi:Polycomb protein Su(z)12 [Toxocara canis]|uniref:Polycomb protein Su(Z)12 n=1 Tax=Toxocara canis TaxID=6265 RepID=A0A0B2UMU2_TOXCA|nr:Polycomb protein Su(z)12 [Toxocara canis]